MQQDCVCGWDGEAAEELKTKEYLRDVRQQVDKPIFKHFKGNSEEHVNVAIVQRMF